MRERERDRILISGGGYTPLATRLLERYIGVANPPLLLAQWKA